jgi:hypothetical protein
MFDATESRKETRPFVLCAQPTGYGPASKLLAIAQNLTSIGVKCVFVGEGIALELVKRSNIFLGVFEAGPESSRVREVFAEASGVLSVMDVGFARVALESSRPLYVADSLAWMRRPIPNEYLLARRYWVQNFPGLREHLAGTDPTPDIVGPIVPSINRVHTPKQPAVVVCLGGYHTPYTRADDDAGYGRFVMQGILDSGLLNEFEGSMLIMAGDDLINRLEEEFPVSGLRYASLSCREADNVRSGAEIVLTAPGLTSTLECFRSGRPTFFLPPQNYSQWIILTRLREAGTAPCSFHWADYMVDCKTAGVWALNERIAMVKDAIETVSTSSMAQHKFREKMGGIKWISQADLIQKQRAFFDSLGHNGARTIAREIMKDVYAGENVIAK